MRIDDPRALALRLIVGELLARPGAGPLAPRHFVRGRRSAPPPEAPAGVPTAAADGDEERQP